MTPQDYLNVIVGFSLFYGVLSFMVVGMKPSKMKNMIDTMQPVFHVSIVCMALTALGYIK